MAAITAVTDSSFETDVLGSDKPVLVDFWAPWCGPCRQLSPIVEEIGVEYADKITVLAMNTDENPATPQRYGIVSIPTLNVYVGGELAKSIVGARRKPVLLEELAEFVA